MTKDKKENFKRIAERRVNKILADIQSLESLRNDAYYEFDVRDKIKIQEAIQKQLNKTMKVLEEGERFKL